MNRPSQLVVGLPVRVFGTFVCAWLIGCGNPVNGPRTPEDAGVDVESARVDVVRARVDVVQLRDTGATTRGCPDSTPGTWMALSGMVCDGMCVEQNINHCGACNVRCARGLEHCCEGLNPDASAFAYGCCPGP